MEEQAKKKTCTKCNVEKELWEFHFKTLERGKLQAHCRECKKEKDKQRYQYNKEKISESKKQHYQDNKEKILERKKQYRKNNKEKISKRRKQYYHNNKEKIIQINKRYKIKNLKRYLFNKAKTRAKKFEREFNITIEDIQLPEYCPVLGIKLEVSDRRPSDNSYSLDRIDSNKGYVKGNVQVISHRANSLKSNATLEELKKLVEWMEKQESLKNS